MEDIISPFVSFIFLRYIIIGGGAALIIWFFQKFIEPKAEVAREKHRTQKPVQPAPSTTAKSQKLKSDLAALRQNLETE